MGHTPTPLKKRGYIKSPSKTFHRQALESSIPISEGGVIISVFASTKETTKEFAEHVMACLNACDGMEDPKNDIGLLKLRKEQLESQLKSCESALEQRDNEIAELRAKVAQLENPWISVADRLPEFGDYVLCLCAIHGRFLGTYEFVGEFKGEKYGNWRRGSEKGVLPPTHWMPLPNPPKTTEP